MKMRKDLLIDLLKHYTIYGKEHEIIPKITEELVKLGFTVSLDSVGNIHAVRGTSDKYPLFNAHMDIVKLVDYGYYYSGKSYYDNKHYSNYDKLIEKYIKEDEKHDTLQYVFDTLEWSDYQKYFVCSECEKCGKCKLAEYNMTCEYFTPNSKGWSTLEGLANDWGIDIESTSAGNDELDVIMDNDTGDETDKKIKDFAVYESKGLLKGTGGRVLGGDDKCGIFIILEIARLLKTMPMKILFTVGEEEGCIGIKHFIKDNENWFEDVMYSITVDRRYNDNLLWSQCGKKSCSNEFASRLAICGIQCGIPVKLEDGSIADVMYIREIVPESVNVSSGYFNPHDEDEYIDLAGVKKIIQWLRTFVTFENGRVQNTK